jgi:hypothetical protein
MQPHQRINHTDVFYLIILITVTLASSNMRFLMILIAPKHVGAVLM